VVVVVVVVLLDDVVHEVVVLVDVCDVVVVQGVEVLVDVLVGLVDVVYGLVEVVEVVQLVEVVLWMLADLLVVGATIVGVIDVAQVELAVWAQPPTETIGSPVSCIGYQHRMTWRASEVYAQSNTYTPPVPVQSGTCTRSARPRKFRPGACHQTRLRRDMTTRRSGV
jgi:hypothetical protein